MYYGGVVLDVVVLDVVLLVVLDVVLLEVVVLGTEAETDTWLTLARALTSTLFLRQLA